MYAHIGVCVLLNKSCSQLGFSQPRDVSELLQRQELLSSCKVLVTDYKHTSVEWDILMQDVVADVHAATNCIFLLRSLPLYLTDCSRLPTINNIVDSNTKAKSKQPCRRL